MRNKRKVIEKTFFRMLEQSPAEKITVKSITEACGLNRNSFYYHFQDIPSLIFAIFQETVLEELDKEKSAHDTIESILCTMMEKRQVLCNLFDSRYSQLVSEDLCVMADVLVRTLLERKMGTRYPMSQEDLETIISFGKYVLIGMVDAYLINAQEGNLQETFERIWQLCVPLMKKMIQETSAAWELEHQPSK